MSRQKRITAKELLEAARLRFPSVPTSTLAAAVKAILPTIRRDIADPAERRIVLSAAVARIHRYLLKI